MNIIYFRLNGRLSREQFVRSFFNDTQVFQHILFRHSFMALQEMIDLLSITADLLEQGLNA